MFIASDEHRPFGSPLSLTLPRKGGGNPPAGALLTPSRGQSTVVTRGKVSTLVRLPPPLRGRVGERGKPRALTEIVARYDLDQVRASIDAP